MMTTSWMDIGISDVLVYHFLQVVLLDRAHDRLHHLPALEQQQRWNAAYLKAKRRVGIVVDVELADSYPPRIIHRDRVDGRRQAFARPAPLRPEIYQHWARRLDDRLLEISIRKCLHIDLHVFSCHGSSRLPNP